MTPHFFRLLYLGLVSLLPLSLQAAAIGNTAPNCQLTAIESEQTHDFKSFYGKVVYVDFWASWCQPCAKSFPFMQQLQQDLSKQGLEVVLVNLDEQAADAKNFLSKYPGNALRVVTDSTHQCAQDYNVEGMPSTYLIDRNGVIRHIHMGFRPEDAEQLRSLVKELLAEQGGNNKHL